mgnify:CR=1 FL=1
MALRIGLLVVLCALRAVAQPLITATFEWDVDAGSPDASAIVERDGVSAPCLAYAQPAETARRCSAQMPSGRASFRVRMVDASGVPGPWSDAVVATIGSGSPPGSFVISWNSSISPGAGPVAFPTTGVLDNFNRANAGPPLSANWTNDPAGLSVAGHQVVSNQASGDGWSAWSAQSFQNCEAFTTFTGGSGTTIGLFARLAPTGASADFYTVEWGASGLAIERIIDAYGAGSGTLATSAIPGPSAGQKIGMRVTGTGASVLIEVFLDTGSGWSLALSATDTAGNRITQAGFIGVLTGGTITFDDFGGGNVSSGPRVFGGPGSGHRRRRLAA